MPLGRVSCGFVGVQGKRGQTGDNPGYGVRAAVDRPVERGSTHPVGTVQRGAVGQARHVVGRQPHGLPTRQAGGLAAAADAGQRQRPGGVLPRPESGRRQRRADEPGVRVADRQLPHLGGEHPAGASRPAPWLLQPAAETGAGRPRRPSQDLRHRVGLRRAHRQPLPPRPVGPLHLRLRTPQGTDPRRTLGGAHQSAYPAHRECPSAGATPGGRHSTSPAGRRTRRSAAWSGSSEPRRVRQVPAACRADWSGQPSLLRPTASSVERSGYCGLRRLAGGPAGSARRPRRVGHPGGSGRAVGRHRHDAQHLPLLASGQRRQLGGLAGIGERDRGRTAHQHRLPRTRLRHPQLVPVRHRKTRPWLRTGGIGCGAGGDLGGPRVTR